MIQSSLLSLCRSKMPEISSTDVLSDADLLILLNLACTEFIEKTDSLPISKDFNLVLNQVDYALSTYVSDFGKPRKEGLWFYNSSTSKWTQLTPTTIPHLKQNYPSWLNTAAGIPQRYSIDGDNLTLHPKASSTYAGTNYLRLYYYGRSVDMSNASHYPFSGSLTKRYPHLANYEEVLTDYVKYLVYPMLGKHKLSQDAQQVFYAKCIYIKSQLAYRPDLVPEVQAQGAGNLLHHQGAFK